MRNLKKILALVLALVMSMSLLATANAFTDDKDIDATYDEAVTVLDNLGVFQGYEDGSFKPTKTIKRNEVAAIIYRIVTGDVENKQNDIYSEYGDFTDVESDDWFAGYVGFCANGGYIEGYPDGSFKPEKTITGYEALAMILRAVGYGKNGEFKGDNWAYNTAARAKLLGVLKNVDSVSLLGQPASRELVAELLFQSILVPQVTWTELGGYSDIGLKVDNKNNWWGKLEKNPSLGMMTFGLDVHAGEITGTVYKKGITVLDGKGFSNTDANWENIGYAAYVYAVPVNVKTNSYKAVSDVNITGTSLGVSTNGTAWNDLINPNNAAYIANPDIQKNMHYYYNGDLFYTITDGVYNEINAADKDAYEAGKGNVGVKFDFIDNDNDGIVDVTVATDYTVAEVNGIATDINTGVNAWEKDHYYVHNLEKASEYTVEPRTGIKVADLVCADELALGDLVTYVEYGGDYYVTLVPFTAGDFTRINYNKVPNTNRTEISYVIGGEPYVKAHAWQGYDKYLTEACAKAELPVLVGVDPYGYMLKVTDDAAVTNYLFPIANDHTSGILKYTDAVVAMPDGSIVPITVAKAYDKLGGALGAFKFDFENNDDELVAHIFKYTAEDTSVLNQDGVDFKTGNLNVTKATAILGGTALRIDNKAVVVDLRAYLDNKADAGTVYTGYAEIPAVTGAVGSYIDKNGDGIIDLLFLTGGTNVTDNRDEFIVFHTGHNYYDGPTDTYYLDVVKDGHRVNDYAVLGDQYRHIQFYGIGRYTYDYAGDLKGFSAFNEIWENAEWGNGIISTYEMNGTQKVYTGTYVDGDDLTFTVIDTTKGKGELAVCEYDHIVGHNYWTTVGADSVDTKAYIKLNADNEAVNIYIVLGKYADTTAEPFYTKTVGNIVKSYYANVDRTDITFCIETPVVEVPEAPKAADYLSNAVADGLTVTAEDVIGGTGTQADPFQMVATGCLNGVENANLTVTAVKTAQGIKIGYSAALDRAVGTGILSYTDSGIAAADGNRWFFTITDEANTVWFVITVDGLNHTETLAETDASKVHIDTTTTNTIYIASSVADESTPVDELLVALGENCTIPAGATVTYNETEGKLYVKSECGEMETWYVLEFVSGAADTNPNA